MIKIGFVKTERKTKPQLRYIATLFTHVLQWHKSTSKRQYLNFEHNNVDQSTI